MNITAPIRDLARTHAGSTAIIRPNDAAITYCSLDRLVDRFARRVLASGISPGHTVGLAIAGPDEALVLVLALALARIGVASADVDIPARYLAAVFVQPGGKSPEGVRAIGIDGSWWTDDGADAAPVAIHGDDAAILRVLSTSGTTGVSRYCPVSHAVMAARVAATGFPVADAQWPLVLICAVGPGGAWGLRTVLKTLSIGGTVVFTNRTGLAGAVLRHGVTSLTISTNTLQAVVATIPSGIGPLPSLRAILTGGSPVPAKLRQIAAQRLCANVMTCFGASEVGTVAIGRPEVLDAVPFAVGSIEPEVEAQAVDDAHTPLPPGTEGALRFRTGGGIAGYLDDEAATHATFRDGWFYSGDRGAVTPEGVLVVTGRITELINHGGVKISPRVIEDVLLSLPEVTQAVAFGVPDTDGVIQIWAAIVADRRVETAVLKRLCHDRLGRRAPKFILQMKDLPRNANGKVLTRPLVDYAISQARRTGAGG